MTEMSPLMSVSDSPEPAKRKNAPRRFRTPLGRELLLTETDLRMMDDLFLLGVASTPAMLLLRRSYDPDGGRNLLHHTRRLTELWRAGWVSRMDPKFGVLRGSRAMYYFLDTGKAEGAYSTRTHHLQIEDGTWKEILKAAAPIREKRVELLASRGFAADLIDTRLERATKTFLRFYSGEVSQVSHRVLCSTAASILLLGARERGVSVSPILPDGVAAFRCTENEKELVIEPDLFLGLGTTGLAIEAETGAHGKAKVTEKIEGYLKLFRTTKLEALREMVGMPEMKQLLVLFHCATDAHARLVASIIGKQKGFGTQFFRITGPSDLSVEKTHDGQGISRDAIALNTPLADGTPTVRYLADRIAQPIFAQYSKGAFSCVPLL